MSEYAPAADVAATRAAIDRLKANMRLTIKGKDGAPQEVPVQVVPCVWAGPFPREDVS